MILAFDSVKTLMNVGDKMRPKNHATDQNSEDLRCSQDKKGLTRSLEV